MRFCTSLLLTGSLLVFLLSDLMPLPAALPQLSAPNAVMIQITTNDGKTPHRGSGRRALAEHFTHSHAS